MSDESASISLDCNDVLDDLFEQWCETSYNSNVEIEETITDRRIQEPDVSQRRRGSGNESDSEYSTNSSGNGRTGIGTEPRPISTGVVVGGQFFAKTDADHDIIHIDSDGEVESQSEENDVQSQAKIRENSKEHEAKRLRYFHQCILRTIQKNITRARIIHDIVPAKAVGGRTGILETCRGTKFNGTIFIIGEHGDHFHVIHDCEYNGSVCKCSRIGKLRRGSRYPRVVVWTRKYSRDHWWNLLCYLVSENRWLAFLEIGRENRLRGHKIGNLSRREHQKLREKGLVESGEVEEPDDHSFTEFEGACSSKTINEGNRNRLFESAKRQQRKKATDAWAFFQFLKKNLSSPISHIANNSHWANTEFALIENTQFNNGISLMEKFVASLSLSDIYDLIRKSNSFIFNAPNGDIPNYYYSENDSVQYLEDLLKWQFDFNTNKMKEFLINLYNVADKRIPKRNCFQVVGPPNSGKNFFFDAVVHFCLSFGMIGNFNKHNQFPLHECINKRILFWNEPNIEPAALETLKMLFGGDTIPVKVKYKSDAIVTRTPVIVLGNYDAFPN